MLRRPGPRLDLRDRFAAGLGAHADWVFHPVPNVELRLRVDLIGLRQRSRRGDGHGRAADSSAIRCWLCGDRGQDPLGVGRRSSRPSEVPGYEVTVQFVPPLVRCRPPGGGAWRSASASGMAALDRWTGPWVIGLAVLEAAAVTSLFFKVRQRRSKAA